MFAMNNMRVKIIIDQQFNGPCHMPLANTLTPSSEELDYVFLSMQAVFLGTHFIAMTSRCLDVHTDV